MPYDQFNDFSEEFKRPCISCLGLKFFLLYHIQLGVRFKKIRQSSFCFYLSLFPYEKFDDVAHYRSHPVCVSKLARTITGSSLFDFLKDNVFISRKASQFIVDVQRRRN